MTISLRQMRVAHKELRTIRTPKRKATTRKIVSSILTSDCVLISELFFPVMSTQRDPEASSSNTADSENTNRKRKRTESTNESASKSKKRQRKGNHDKEYGVTRGVDFVDVACVLNFDLPTSSRSYTHRVGRTARAGRTGMALSFVVPKDQWGKNKIVGCLPSAKNDEAVFDKIEKEQGARGSKIKEYNFDMKQVEAFRYRMEDALRSVTRSAIKEARIKELKTEILNSDKLKVRLMTCICHIFFTESLSGALRRQSS